MAEPSDAGAAAQGQQFHSAIHLAQAVGAFPGIQFQPADFAIVHRHLFRQRGGHGGKIRAVILRLFRRLRQNPIQRGALLLHLHLEFRRGLGHLGASLAEAQIAAGVHQRKQGQHAQGQHHKNQNQGGGAGPQGDAASFLHGRTS